MNRHSCHLSKINSFHIFNSKIPPNSGIKSIDQPEIKSSFLLLSISLNFKTQSRLKILIQSLFPVLLLQFLQGFQNLKTLFQLSLEYLLNFAQSRLRKDILSFVFHTTMLPHRVSLYTRILTRKATPSIDQGNSRN